MLENVYISIGELWDKYSILEIKKKNIKEIEKNEIIQEEIKLLNLRIGKYNLNDNLYIRQKIKFEKKKRKKSLTMNLLKLQGAYILQMMKEQK